MDENFFENLANGKPLRIDTENDAEETGMGTFEVELAKADANAAVASRRSARSASASANAAKESRTETWDDGEPEGSLMVDVYQTDSDIVVESAMAGVKPEDIDVNVTTDSISIKGARYREEKVADENYYHQECYWGRFARSIILPQEVDPESAEVLFKNGILTVRLPKVNKKKTRKLKVRFD
jgi:HSP20 family protein